MKQTKIVATVGPASEGKDTLRQMIQAGMNVVRLNFSHNEHAWHKEVIKRVRELSEELKTPVALLADIQGPRIRLKVAQDFAVARGEKLKISDIANADALSGEENARIVFLDQPNMSESLEVGHTLLIEDGALLLEVSKKEGKTVEATVMNDGIIKNRKGVNLPDSNLKLSVLTSKDEADLAFVVREGVDYVGLSFVGNAEDIRGARKKMKEFSEDGAVPKIVAKIERKEAIKNLEEIVAETDAVMVARGDLGIEMPESEVILSQKRIVFESLKQVKPVIVATQMMKSMTENPRPTRAEVSDVSNAAIDHADAVMLSEESAMGKYPVETIAMMSEILEKTEASPYDDVTAVLPTTDNYPGYTALVRSMYELALSYEARAILLLTASGLTARLMSHFRPSGRVLAATNNRRTWNQLALVWGVDAYLFEGNNDLDGFIEELAKKAKTDKKLLPGDKVVICQGKSRNSEMQLVGMKEVV